MIKDVFFKNEYIRKHISIARLEDVIAVAEYCYINGKKQREICFFVRLFSGMAGYSKGAARELTEIINSRFRKPLHSWQLNTAISSAEKCFEDESSVMFYYCNERLVKELGIRNLEKNLALKTIMSDKERRRRKAIRDAVGYARRRGGPSKRDKIKKRISAMAVRYLKGTLDRKCFQREYKIGRSTFYTDLKTAEKKAFYILLLCARLCSFLQRTGANNRHSTFRMRMHTAFALYCKTDGKHRIFACGIGLCLREKKMGLQVRPPTFYPVQKITPANPFSERKRNSYYIGFI